MMWVGLSLPFRGLKGMSEAMSLTPAAAQDCAWVHLSLPTYSMKETQSFAVPGHGSVSMYRYVGM